MGSRINTINYKHKNSLFQEHRRIVLDHMLGYLDDTKIDMTESTLFLLGYLDTPQWVDALTALGQEYHPAIQELALIVDERYSTDFHSSLL